MEKIECYIIEHNLKSGDKLPAERQLCEMWHMNRSTLRGAIRQLILEGKIYNRGGAGTFVAMEKLTRNLQEDKGFYQTAIEAQRKLTTKVLEMGFCETTKPVGRKMKLPLGHPLFYLSRIRYLDGVPVLISTTYLDRSRFYGIERYDYSRDSLYGVLKTAYGVTAAKGLEKVGITYCDEEEAGCFGIEPGAAVIYQSGIARDNQDVIFEYFKELTRSEYIRSACLCCMKGDTNCVKAKRKDL